MFLHRRCHSAYLVVLVVLSFSLRLPAEENVQPVSYTLKVAIDPAAGNIAVRGDIELPLRSPHQDTIQFALHETFSIEQLSVNGRTVSFSTQSAEPSPIYPATKNVLARLPSDILPDRIHVHLAYGGRLKNIPEFGTFPDQKQALDDQINSRLVELANYSSWYPQFFVMGSPLAVNLELSLPQAWTAVCSGRKLDEHVEDGRAITRWSSPNDTDILIAAAPNYKRKSRRVSETAIEMYYTQLPEEFIEKETRQIADVTKLFAGYLGETTIPAGTIKHVYSPMRKGQGRAGIARPGMIVTSEGRVMEELAKDPKFSLFQDVAHEIAHFWWNFGAGQGDWINEAFAEYFSAVAVQKVLSQQQFDRVIENYRNEVRRLPANSPSLSTVPFDGSFFVVRYYKASLLLDHLRSALGDDRFFQASRNFFQAYRGKAIGTAEFRDFWRQRLGDQGKSLDRWLDSTGGLPELAQKQVTRHGNPGLEQMALGSLEVLTDVPADTSLLPP